MVSRLYSTCELYNASANEFLQRLEQKLPNAKEALFSILETEAELLREHYDILREKDFLRNDYEYYLLQLVKEKLYSKKQKLKRYQKELKGEY